MRLLNRCYSYISIIFSSLIFANITYASSPETHYTIPHTNLSAKIDGELTDPVWQNAKKIKLNLVNSPWNNEPSPVETEAQIIENGEMIFISFIAYDPEPQKIKAFLGDRDSRWTDDIVGIKLDTFNTRRLNYEFFVNPFGVQHDGINNEMTGEVNRAWNGIWDSYGKLTPQGFQVEIAIPYSILNFENSDDVKIWAFELVRLYPRDSRLRISHSPLDRNNNCWLCQAPELSGFKQAKGGKNFMVTPSLVAAKNQSKDIFTPGSDWQSDSDSELGLDLRWNINTNNLLNATINPDFSTVEVDAGQLNINKTYSLYYEERRPFFLDNADYFTSNLDLVYTRNIADPDFGAKLTGTQGEHSYGVFVTRDKETNFVVPGNTGSDIASIDDESTSAALRYRYDLDKYISFGAVSTLRKSDDYHNYLAGIDTKYKLDDSNAFKAQWLASNTEYPEDLYQSFCYGDSDDSCDNSKIVECSIGQCPYTEQVHRTRKSGEFSDSALTASFEHESEYWEFEAEHQTIGQDFRADLGFITSADIKSNRLALDRYFYGDTDSPWQELELEAQWQIKHNEKGELLEKSWQAGFNIDGPMQSYFELILNYDDKIGLRHKENLLAIDGNTSRFTEKMANMYAKIQPGRPIGNRWRA